MRNIQPGFIKPDTAMKKNITILQSMKQNSEIRSMKTYWKWFCTHSFKFGVFFGILAYLCILFSFDKTGGIMAMICLLCFWADDENKERK